MVKKIKKPDYYKCPLKKREDIINWIYGVTSQRHYNGDNHPFCFNVKVYDLDFSFEHLLKIAQEESGDSHMTNPDWIEQVRKRFEGIKEDTLWTWGQEYACGHFISLRRDGSLDSDVYTQLWNGTPIDVRYSFEGRSGGWLSINRFEGYNFNPTLYEDLKETLREMPFATLRKFYQLVVMLKHDLRPQNIKSMMETGAAWDFFVNICADMPKPDARQLRLAL